MGGTELDVLWQHWHPSSVQAQESLQSLGLQSELSSVVVGVGNENEREQANSCCSR